MQMCYEYDAMLVGTGISVCAVVVAMIIGYAIAHVWSK